MGQALQGRRRHGEELGEAQERQPPRRATTTTGGDMSQVTRRWRFRAPTASSVSWPRHWGIHVGEDRLGGHGEHYGYPWTRVGLFLLWGHICWFVGWELVKVDEETKK